MRLLDRPDWKLKKRIMLRVSTKKNLENAQKILFNNDFSVITMDYNQIELEDGEKRRILLRSLPIDESSNWEGIIYLDLTSSWEEIVKVLSFERVVKKSF